MHGMLGADPASLAALAGTMTETATQLAEVQADAARIADRVVTDTQQAFDIAVREIGSAMAAMTGQVGRAESEAAAAMWTGRNYEAFVASSGDFAQSARRIDTDTQAAYGDFTASMQTLSQTLLSFQASLQTHLSAAETASTSMGQAVTAQQDALDATMNTGMSFG